MSRQLTIFDALNDYKDVPPSVPFVDEVEKFTVMYDDFLKDKKSVEMPF